MAPPALKSLLLALEVVYRALCVVFTYPVGGFGNGRGD